MEITMKKRLFLVLAVLFATALLFTGCGEESIFDGTWVANGSTEKIVIKGSTLKTYDNLTDTRPSSSDKIEINGSTFSYDGLTGKLSADGKTLRMEIDGYANFAILFTKQ